MKKRKKSPSKRGTGRPSKPEVRREGNIIYIPFPKRERTKAEDSALNAATEWILTELDNEPASLAVMRKLAENELQRPRSSTHKRWATLFLKETENYGTDDVDT